MEGESNQIKEAAEAEKAEIERLMAELERHNAIKKEALELNMKFRVDKAVNALWMDGRVSRGRGCFIASFFKSGSEEF